MTAGQIYTQDIAADVLNPNNNECGAMALVPLPNFSAVVDNKFVHKPTLEDVGTVKATGFINNYKSPYLESFYPTYLVEPYIAD
jgi:hypothetical protein